MDVDEHGRPDTVQAVGETQSLVTFLDHQRATFAWKCRGLTDAQLRTPLPSSSLTLGGLLHHLAFVEDKWFTEVVAERRLPEPWDPDQDPAERWEQVWAQGGTLPGDVLHERWRHSVEASRAVVGQRPDLEATHPAWDGAGQVSLRWVLLHMVEEYARHNGHADLLREAIDGEVGE